MQAFHNDPAIKQKYLDRVTAHRAADELVQGTGWENGKGCAVGCTLEAYNHSRYPIELGVPEMSAHLEDAIFEGLPKADAQQWPERFLTAIPVGADLSLVGWQFQHWLLTESQIGAYDHELLRDAVQQCAAVLEPLTRGEKADVESAEAAAWSAELAAESAAESAESAARSARSAELAAESVWAAAWSAAESARSAAESARSAAESVWAAAWSAAELAELAESAESARSAAYQKMADKLIELLQSV